MILIENVRLVTSTVKIVQEAQNFVSHVQSQIFFLVQHVCFHAQLGNLGEIPIELVRPVIPIATPVLAIYLTTVSRVILQIF